MIDPVEFGKQMAAIVRESTAPLLQRISELEKSLAAQSNAQEMADSVDVAAIARAAAELVPVPQDGESVTVDDVKPLVAELVDAAVKAMPNPRDGSSVTVDDVAPLIRNEIDKAIAQIPAPQDGKSVTADDVRPILVELVDSAVKALPAPKDGTDGKDADMAELKLHLSELVKHVQMPAPPSVGEVAAVFERRFSDLTLSWERQARDTFERAVDRMPAPKDGRDALPLESFDLSLAEDGRTITVKMQAGETVMEKSLKIASVIDRGAYKSQSEYECGDAVTHGGSLWIAQADAPEGAPGLGGKGWRLAVKKGRDGKDLRDNAGTVNPSKGVSIK